MNLPYGRIREYYFAAYAQELARLVARRMGLSAESVQAAADAAKSEPVQAVRCYAAILSSWSVQLPERKFFVVAADHGGQPSHQRSRES